MNNGQLAREEFFSPSAAAYGSHGGASFSRDLSQLENPECYRVSRVSLIGIFTAHSPSCVAPGLLCFPYSLSPNNQTSIMPPGLFLRCLMSCGGAQNARSLSSHPLCYNSLTERTGVRTGTGALSGLWLNRGVLLPAQSKLPYPESQTTVRCTQPGGSTRLWLMPYVPFVARLRSDSRTPTDGPWPSDTRKLEVQLCANPRIFGIPTGREECFEQTLRPQAARGQRYTPPRTLGYS